jgi:hypothetical protein
MKMKECESAGGQKKSLCHQKDLMILIKNKEQGIKNLE